jgi:Tfp pilus assembly pilus retraction ATPase PilT
MQTFNHSIHQLIKDKRITEEEGYAYSTNPAALQMMLSGINLSEGRRIVD